MNVLQQYCDIWDETSESNEEIRRISSWFNDSKGTSAKIREKAQVSLHTHTALGPLANAPSAVFPLGWFCERRARGHRGTRCSLKGRKRDNVFSLT